MMGNVLLLCFSVCFSFAICGVQLWSGLLHNRCTIGETGNDTATLPELDYYVNPFARGREYICSTPDDKGMHKCDFLPTSLMNGSLCGPSNVSICPDFSAMQHFNVCSPIGPDPFNGSISFDNVLKGFITVFVIIGLNGWVDIMYYVQDSHSVWCWVYFVILIVVGSFYMLNLFLAVIATQFATTKAREMDIIETQKHVAEEETQAGKVQSIMRHLWRVWTRTFSRDHTKKRMEMDLCRMNTLSQQEASPTAEKDAENSGEKSAPSDPLLTTIIHGGEGDPEGPTCSRYLEPREVSDDEASATESEQHERLEAGSKGKWLKTKLYAVQQSIGKLVNSSGFITFVMGAIFLNTVTMAVEHHNQAEGLTRFLDISNLFFTALFALEMVLKLIGLTPKGYIKETFNLFDGTIVVVSLVEILLSGEGGLSVLRTFRLLRVFKLIRFINSLRRQLIIMWKCVNNVAVFAILLGLFIFTFTLLGMVLFGGKFCTTAYGAFCNCTDILDPNIDCFCSRANFDTFFDSCLTVFIILTGAWCLTLYEGMFRAGSWYSLYFLAIMLIGNYIFFNLLVGILLEGFSETDDDGNDITNHETAAETVCICATGNQAEIAACESAENGEIQVLNSSYCPVHDEQKEESSNTKYSLKDKISMWFKSCWSSFKDCYHNHSWFGKHHHHSLFIFDQENSVRQFCTYLIKQPWFDNMVLFFIGLNCIVFAVERPSIDEDSLERQLLRWSNYIFTAIFTIEMLIKVIAMNLVIGSKNAYLRTGWNVLDGTLVLVGLLSLSVELWMIMLYSRTTRPKLLGMIRIFRLLRALRPLRVIHRAPGLKIVVETLMSSLKPIGSVLLICGLFFLIYAILGVQLFKGQHYRCVGRDLGNITTKHDCEMGLHRRWTVSSFNFDDLGQAFLTLFVLSTLDGWNDIMYSTMDITGIDKQPIRNSSPWNCLYFILFLFTVAFFVLNMFVGVVVENFQKNFARVQKERRDERIGKDVAKHFYNIGYTLTTTKVKLPFWVGYSSLRMTLYRNVSGKQFDIAVSAIIGVNILTMSMEHYQMSPDFVTAAKILNYIFTAIYTIEAFLRMVAFGVKQYFSESWNRLDIFVIVASVVGIAIEELKDSSLPVQPSIIRLMRVLRLARVFKLLKMAKAIRSLLDCVSKAFPQVSNLAILFLLLFYIFAALGVELFGEIECSVLDPCVGMDEHANFKNFPMAFLTLFRVCTGDSWTAILQDTMKNSASMPPLAAPLYFVLFILFSTYILMNLVIAVLLQFLEESTHSDEDQISDTDDDHDG